MDDAGVINFLLQTEIIPLCLRIMETGSELSKTVATFIIQKVLTDDRGLHYICATYERCVRGSSSPERSSSMFFSPGFTPWERCCPTCP